MTNILDSSSDHDQERLREILERTGIGLREDLDELRDELVDELERFEPRIRDVARDLPGWLDVPGTSLRAPFKLTDPTRLEGTLIGPRTVAIVAGDLENFLVEWIGDGGAIPAWKRRDDAEAVERLFGDLQDLRELNSQAIDAVEQLADDGPLQLEQILESIVFELESRRETDVEALESLIQDGDVDPGRNARAEIAELWEEQRQRVDNLQKIWDDLLNLHHEGVTRTLDGLDEIQALLDRAVHGIRGAGLGTPALAKKLDLGGNEATEEWNAADVAGSDDAATSSEATESADGREDANGDPPSDPSAPSNRFVRDSAADDNETDTTNGDDGEKDSEPDTIVDDDIDGDLNDSVDAQRGDDDSTSDGEDNAPTSPETAEDSAHDAAKTPEADVSDEISETAEIAEQSQSMGQTVDLFEGTDDDRPQETIPDSSRAAETAPIATADADGGHTNEVAKQPDIDTAAGLDDAPQTQPPSPVESPGGDGAPTVDATPETAESVGDPTTESTPDSDDEQGRGDEGPSTELPDPADQREDTVVRSPASNSASPSEEADNADDADDDHKLRVRTFRVRQGWQSVGGDEVAATIGPPGLFVAALLVMCLLSLVGLAPNPMASWDWALPASFGAMLLLVALPLLARWRPMWDDMDFQLLRRGPIEEEVDLQITADDQLCLDRTTWDIRDISPARLRRWDAPESQARGWLLTIDPPYHSPVHLMSIAGDNTDWQQSNADHTTPPDDAWQLPPDEFRTIRRALDVDDASPHA